MEVNTVSGQVAKCEVSGRPVDAPPPYSPPAAAPAPDVVITSEPSAIQQHVIQLEVPLRSKPIFHTCSYCNKRVYTQVKYISSNKTHLCAGFLCGLTVWCFICCVGILPYYINSFKKAEHYCPSCNQLLGTYSKL